jgi:hypothetical protein
MIGEEKFVFLNSSILKTGANFFGGGYLQINKQEHSSLLNFSIV